jgi:hypothetical protein
MATLMDILGGGLPAGLLSPEQEAAAQQRAQAAGLLNFAFGALQASRGAPGQGRPSLGQIIGQAGPVGVAGYQQSFDQTLANTLRGMQVAEMRRRQQTAEQLRQIAPSLIRTVPGQPERRETFATETGDFEMVTQPARPSTYSINTDVLPALAALGPEGMEYASNVAKFQETLAPKTSIQKIYDAQGREQTVRYNERTGEITPLGGAKAEAFVQVDRGNVIELIRPTTGELVGRLPKGVAPTAPSYTMTETGQILNTRTGQLVQPTDAQGNPVAVDLSHKATEGERLSSGFYMRMADASNTFTKPITGADGKEITDANGKVITIEDVASRPEKVAEFVGAVIPNWMGGQAAKQQLTTAFREQYEQAQENWVTANLRKESGAVIGPEEMQKEIRKWFPVVGNSQDVIEQKRQARKIAEESMRRNAGRALVVQQPQQRNVTVNY